MAQCAKLIQFPGRGESPSKAQQVNIRWHSRIFKFCVNLALTQFRRFLTFCVLVFATAGNTLFAIGTGLVHFIFRFMAILAMVLGLGYAFFAWLFVVGGKAHSDPYLWEYLGRFEIGMLILFTVGIALDLALTMGKGWIYAHLEKVRPLIAWGLK